MLKQNTEKINTSDNGEMFWPGFEIWQVSDSSLARGTVVKAFIQVLLS